MRGTRCMLMTLITLQTALTGAAAPGIPLRTGTFAQQVHVPWGPETGLPAEPVLRLSLSEAGCLHALCASGAVFVLEGATWEHAPGADADQLFPSRPWYPGLSSLGLLPDSVRCVAQRGDEVAVAARDGLFARDGEAWRMLLPDDGATRWAPRDVRAVCHDTQGRLWFAAPQGVGSRDAAGAWRLYTGAEGLPFNDFTAMAAGPSGVWFGTTNGAIQFHEGQWRFRQGRRWLMDNNVHDIVVDAAGSAWFATDAGVSCIREDPMTLAGKAAFYESEVEKYHRRTRFGYLGPATLATPGDKSSGKPTYTDNDGFNTGLYLAAMSLAWAVTGEERHRTLAHNAFRALAFLSEVTQDGRYGGPEGLIARNVVPTSEPDPGAIYDRDYDAQRRHGDALWKVMERRVPIDASGQWYWKADSSSDELDGHYFGCAVYYDRVCATEPEREAVRAVVRRITDHLIRHGYSLIDYDGTPTRWAHFSPDDMNRNPAWQAERGLNCYSILTYLAIAYHVLGDARYREEYLRLALDEGYGMNGMTQPKDVAGPNDPGHQPDDNMAFMNYYHLLRYEDDPQLLSMYHHAIRTLWNYERFDRNAFSNYVYAACTLGRDRTDQWGTVDLSPPLACYEDAADTLVRYPLDLIEWPMANAHRIDMRPVGAHGDGPPRFGGNLHGYAFPIDERQEIYWDWNYWQLSYDGDGTTLRPPHHYLLAYYLGRFHGFLAE